MGHEKLELFKGHIKRNDNEWFEPPSLLTKTLSTWGIWILKIVSNISNALFSSIMFTEKNRDGYESLVDKTAAFRSRYIYRRFADCWNNVICSVPADEVIIKDRISQDNNWSFKYKGSNTKCLNLTSYNYLGFSQATGPCAENAIESIYTYGITSGSTRHQHGTCAIHDQLEQLVAEFLGVEDAITFGMGYATNALNLPALLSPGCLVVSDQKNHNSIIVGLRQSTPTLKIFKHNDIEHLENILKEAITYGQPNQSNNEYKPWKKIFIVVEGIYSMDATICSLPEMIALKKKYKAYLYVDEAHSIGALGKRGRGVVDYYNCNPKDIDMLMGTFTKSFGAAGGYIAGTKELVTFLREYSHASRHGWAMAPPVAAQIISAIKIIMGKDGTNEGQRKLMKLARNTRYLRIRLKRMGLVISGNDDSPVVPIIVHFFSKMTAFTRMAFEENIATAGVAYPVTNQPRIRLCLSADHSEEQLDYALQVIEKLADELGLKYLRKPLPFVDIKI